MHKSATKCNETLGKWCKNKHGASKIIDTLETYQRTRSRWCLRRVCMSCRSRSHDWRSGTEQELSAVMPNWLGGRPYKTSNEEVPSAKCKLVLYQYSAREIHWIHFIGQAWAKHRRYPSKHWLTRSVWPSVWGWYEELIFRLVPVAENN
jgi:hypothetical protein